MIIDNNPKKKILAIVSVVIAIIAVIVAGLYLAGGKKTTSEQISFEITGVPYAGIFTDNANYKILSHDTSAAVVSVADYWFPGGENYVEINRFFTATPGKFIDFLKIREYFEKTGDYNVSNEKLEIGDLKKYINPAEKTPLILFLAIDEKQPLEIYYHPAKVLIGINEPAKTLTLHDYWLGNNYTITYDEFNKLWERMRPDERNKYLVVQPKNYKDILKKKSAAQPYSARTKTMSNTEKMFKNYAIARGAQSRGQEEITLAYFMKVQDDPNFGTYFPPSFKVNFYYRLAEAYLDLKNFDNAIVMANKAVELNQDLDQPSGDWPGTAYRMNEPAMVDRSSSPYRVLGDIYKAQKDFAKSKENYLKALEISPTNKWAKDGLQVAELELDKGTR